MDSQSNISIPVDSESDPRLGRQDFHLENTGWTRAQVGRQLAQLLWDLAFRAQQGHRNRVPALLRGPFGCGVRGKYRIQPPTVRQPRAFPHADLVERSELASARQAASAADRSRVARSVRLSGTGGGGGAPRRAQI